ncbi:hemolysin regulation protein AhpA [Haemophilus paracuniculus]|uniref:Hemolysin regulation protein AhpA n=1 Tax=Haemophilus paracuniculus TaxID=734 RepID=A0A1T0AN52_9PAST|nr:YtjB family periplasmic protein [Haemophilus paracuniculus]OOR97192.1 hemolysin regulation protein AhpA [Haemophilus paracuniculus]
MYISRERLLKISVLAMIMAVCVAIIGVVFMGVNQFKSGSKLASINQVTNLSHLLVRQQANLFALMLTKNAKNDELVEALDSFAKQDFVLDANLYSPTGSLLAQSKNALEIKALLQQPAETRTTQQIVEPIFAQQDLVGFLRITFDAQYGQSTQAKVEKQFSAFYGELLILILAGALLASSLHTFWRRKVVHIHATPKTEFTNEKSQSKRFHSRRRTFQRK